MSAATTALAGQWQQNSKGWWWQEDNGTYPKSQWQWIDGNKDGIAECYYFDNSGYMLSNTTTPDGYVVNGLSLIHICALPERWSGRCEGEEILKQRHAG